MLSGYYFLGLGNVYEGYTLLSGIGLEKVFVFPFKDYNNSMISVNQFVDQEFFEYPTIAILSGENELSGELEVVTSITEDNTVDVNAMFNSYIPPDRFCINDIFVVSSTIGLYKTSNMLYDTANTIGKGSFGLDRIDVFQEESIWVNYRNSTYLNRLLVEEDLIDLEIVRSHCENVFEYLDQFDITLSTAILSSQYWNNWYQLPINHPISNFGDDINLSSIIYEWNYSQSNNAFFKFDKDMHEFERNLTSYDVYVCDNNYEYQGYENNKNVYSNLLSGFSFRETRYVLSGNSYFATLYKNQNRYFPIHYSNNPISDVTQINISTIGSFEIISGNAGLDMSKQNSFYYKNKNIYNIGDWLSGLSYTSGIMTNVTCQNFRVEEGEGYNWYPDLIGVPNITDTENKSVELLTRIHNVPDKLQVYVAIDPASYTIAL